MDYESDSESNENNDENNSQIIILEKTKKIKICQFMILLPLYNGQF